MALTSPRRRRAGPQLSPVRLDFRYGEFGSESPRPRALLLDAIHGDATSTCGVTVVGAGVVAPDARARGMGEGPDGAAVRVRGRLVGTRGGDAFMRGMAVLADALVRGRGVRSLAGRSTSRNARPTVSSAYVKIPQSPSQSRTSREVRPSRRPE